MSVFEGHRDCVWFARRILGRDPTADKLYIVD